MKKFLLLLIVGLFGYWGWENQTKVKDWWQNIEGKIQGFFVRRTEAPPEELPEPVVAEETSPAPVKTTPAPPVIPAKLPELPEGTYFAKERLTMMTDQGVRSIALGTRVQKVGEEAGKLIVDDGRCQIAADPWKLTRDPLEVATLTQQMSGTGILPAGPSATTKSSSKPASSTTVSKPKLVVDQTAINVLKAQIEGVNAQLENFRSELGRARSKEAGAAMRGNSSGYGAITSRLSSQIQALEAQRTALKMKLAALPR